VLAPSQGGVADDDGKKEQDSFGFDDFDTKDRRRSSAAGE
jgi:hypothetical protein